MMRVATGTLFLIILLQASWGDHILRVEARPSRTGFVKSRSIPRLEIRQKSMLPSPHASLHKDDESVAESQYNAESYLEDRRRSLHNLLLLSSISLTNAAISPPVAAAHAFSFGGGEAKEVKPTIATDIMGSPIVAQAYLSKKSAGDYTMVQGLKGDPTYLLVKADGSALESYALNAECTHLGCIVPWDGIQKKFICPCHGSQYDGRGNVLRGPAPGALKLARVNMEEDSGKVLLMPWTDDDFRTGEKPWWI